MKLTPKQRQVLEFVQATPAQIAHLQGDSLVMHHTGSGDSLKHVGLSVAHLLCDGFLKPLSLSKGVEVTAEGRRALQS